MVRALPRLCAHVRSRLQRCKPDIVFAKVNTEEQQDIAAAFNIRSIPTLMFFRDQIIIYSEAGALPATFGQLVDQAMALDMDKVRAEIAEQGSRA